LDIDTPLAPLGERGGGEGVNPLDEEPTVRKALAVMFSTTPALGAPLLLI
jgi:hypothetical protein